MLREKYESYLINLHGDLSKENREYMVDVFENWVNDGNVEEWDEWIYRTNHTVEEEVHRRISNSLLY